MVERHFRKGHFKRKTAICMLFSLVASGCVSTSLQHLEVSAPPVRHPVLITENQAPSNLALRSYLSSNNEKFFRTRIDSNSPNSSSDSNDNLVWHVPSLQIGLDAEYTLSKRVVLTLGGSVSEIRDKIHWGPKVGIGFYGEGHTLGHRIDLLLQTTMSRYNAEVRENFAFWSYHSTDQGKKSYGNVAIMYSLNTRGTNRPIKLFANVVLGGQTLYQHDDFSAFQFYYSLSGGLFKTFGKRTRFIVGGRITRFEEEHRSELIMPDLFVQMDFIVN